MLRGKGVLGVGREGERHTHTETDKEIEKILSEK